MQARYAIALSAGALVAALANGSTPAVAQHSYTPQQIQQGKALYDANCGRCHNDDGAGVTGIELFKQIRRASSDDDIARLIQNGIPGTSMPPHAFSTEQAMTVVAYMRSMVGAPPGGRAPAAPVGGGGPVAGGLKGDAARGKSIFTGKGNCAGCHRAEGSGGTSAPDLSEAGVTRSFGPFAFPPDPAAFERSMLEPDADIAAGFERYQVTPKNGAAVRGILLNQDTFSVQMRDEMQQLRSFMKTDLKEFGYLPSPMPSYRNRLTTQEMADVIAYLLTLKGSRR